MAARVAANSASRTSTAHGGITYAGAAAAAGNARTADTGNGASTSTAGLLTGTANGLSGNKQSNVGGCDEEGFQPVRARGWRKARGTAAQGGDEDATDGGQDIGGQGVAGRVDGDVDAAQGDEVEQTPPTPSDLHRAWQDEVSIVRQLKQQGLATEHPAMRAACASRDAAESAWRSAKDPAPAAVRLARAQAKLDRAIELQAETRNALAEYESEHAAKLAVLHSRMDEDRARVRSRRQQLEAIQAEVGAEGLGARARAQQGEAVKEVHRAICGTVAPTIAALVEQLDSATPAWTMLNGLLGTLSSSKALLGKAITATPTTQQYDITDEADGDGEDGDELEGSWEGSQWSESHELHTDAAGSAAQGNAGGSKGPFEGTGAATASNAAATTAQGAAIGRAATTTHGDHCMGTGDWWDAPYAGWGSGARWEACGHGKWARTSWAEAWEMEHDQQRDDECQPAAARRRLEPIPADGANGVGKAAVDEAADAEARKRRHNERVDRIIQAAIDAGVQPLTQSGEELHALDPHQLDAWVAENLTESAGW